MGHRAGILDMVAFFGESVSRRRAAFREEVDDYLEACAKTGKKPQKPVLEKLLYRVPPEVYAGALVEAEVAGKGLN